MGNQSSKSFDVTVPQPVTFADQVCSELLDVQREELHKGTVEVSLNDVEGDVWEEEEEEEEEEEDELEEEEQEEEE